MNGVPATPREELIAELEGYGYDTMPGAVLGWRDTMSDAFLAEAVARLRGTDEPDYPDLSEMVDAIRAAERGLAAGQTILAGNDFTDGRSLFTNTPFFAPLASCRAVLARIDAMMAAVSGAAGSGATDTPREERENAR